MTNETKKNTKAVAEKKAVEKQPKIDKKAVAEKLEATFKSDKTVDVVADTNREYAKSVTYQDYSYIHFYNPGTEKDMFGCYLIGKGKVRFALSMAVAEFLDASLTVKPVFKKIKDEKRQVAIDVICDIQDAADVAKKIISAYQSKPAKAEKSEKKAVEKKPAAEKKTVAKKATTAKKAAK